MDPPPNQISSIFSAYPMLSLLVGDLPYFLVDPQLLLMRFPIVVGKARIWPQVAGTRQGSGEIPLTRSDAVSRGDVEKLPPISHRNRFGRYFITL